MRQAIEASPQGECARAIAALSNRVAQGEFSNIVGKISCATWTVALWKDSAKTKVRPVSGGGALRKLIVKAHCDQVKEQLKDIVGDTQLGVLEGGYETGVHVMRELSNIAMLDGDVILLIDFANAFNACNLVILII